MAVANADPDGQTLLMAHNGIVTSNKFLYSKPPIDVDQALTPVAPLVQANQMLLANPSVKADDLRGFAEMAKASPGKFSYGTFGKGSSAHLAWAIFAHEEQLDLLEVPYKGIADVMQALLGNQVQLSIGSGAVAGSLISSGRLKPLAVASPERDPRYPDVKTTTELGYPYLQIAIWHSLLAPAGTPSEITHAIAQDVRQVLDNPEFQNKFPDFVVLKGGPDEMAKRLAEESEMMKKMIEVAGVEPQ